MTTSSPSASPRQDERPCSSLAAPATADILPLDPAITVGAAVRAVRRSADDDLFESLVITLRRQAAAGDAASTVVADWMSRSRGVQA